jgi:tetratricopeptide (TPR) repeat protein
VKTPFLVLIACAFAACITFRPDPPGTPEAVSLTGEPLERPVMKPEDARRREEDLEQAKNAFDANRHDVDAVIWYGRRLAYVGRFRDAITVYTMGLVEHPDDARLFRHRGHRWITLRRFDRAIADLEIAARLVEGKPDEPEPAGTPNARGIPVDTLKHNVYYHLALAHYLRGEFEASLPVWEECARWSTNPDTLCSVTHWRYMTLRRLGRDEEAQKTLEPIRKDLDVVEYHAYHRLCLAYRGEVSFDDLWDELRKGDRDGSDFPTIGYGVANWHLYNGRPALGMGIMREVAQASLWPAFGRIAAEAEVAGAHESD